MLNIRNKRVHRLCNVIVILSVILAIITLLFYRQLNKHMSEICEYKGRETATEIITTAINSELEKEAFNFINIIRNNNEISSIETNQNEINKFQNELQRLINNSFKDYENKNMNLPLGTLSGINLFSGRGPNVSIQLHQVGAVDVVTKSEFTSAGINQTKHRIYMNIKIELSAILPTTSTDIEVADDYLISETIIVGNVPNAYLNSEKT